jgi:hypothetical protein
MTQDVKVDKAKFDAALRKMIASRPMTFREAVDKPKTRKGGGVKQNKTGRPGGQK